MQLGWIDFSKEDRQKAFDVINLLSEQGAVDELGIGVIRDAFANYFFPGTSTIQTRAKYFLIVPYMLRYNKQLTYSNYYVMNKLRVMFARISVSMLEPDLVIMDEFQRFKFLLSSDDSELGILAHSWIFIIIVV